MLDRAPGYRVEGAGKLSVHLADSDVATVLLHVVRRYCYEVEMLDPLDVAGHSADAR
ncbi:MULTISPECIES: hypothetical protein [unclassified Streptomyces]|uniref:hypothetical protein n=1 Tax=unclassified Streptomyces TaxID=2593676 RepID=UPI0021564A4F|nr:MULTISPECIES: hypothetical protein [unclassified Streptomyces]